MTRYEEMWQTKDLESALKQYHTDKEMLDADSASFQSIENIDIGEHYIVSYSSDPVILPISELSFIKVKEMFGRKWMWIQVSDDLPQLLSVKDTDNIDTIVKMLLERNNKIGYIEEMPQKVEKEPKPVPNPVAKLPQSSVDAMHQKIEYIISLSKKLAETDKKCYVKLGEPLDDVGMKAINEWCKTNGVYLPEPYIILLSHANGFLVDFDSTKVGYFSFDSFDTTHSPDEKYHRTKDELLARKYESYINCKTYFGALAYVGFHYNPYTGEMFFEKTGGFGWEEKYIPIKDFEKEVLDKVIEYLEKYERKGKLMKETAKNPMKKYYDRVLEYMDDRDDPDMAVYAPLTKKEITAWEKSHDIKLPRDYKNWLMLSDGGEFADKSIYKLEELDTDNPAIDPASGKGYITIANLSGFSDCLVFDPKTKEMFILTDDGKCRVGDFIFHVFQEGFKELDESEE